MAARWGVSRAVMELATSDATSTEASNILMDRLASLRGLVDNRVAGAANDIDPRTQLRYADTEQSHKPRSPFSFATRSRGRAGSPKRARRLTSKPAAEFAEEPGSDTSDGTHTGDSEDDGQSARGSASAAAGAPRGKSREGGEKDKDDAGGGGPGRLRRKSAWAPVQAGAADAAAAGSAGGPPPSAGGAGVGGLGTASSGAGAATAASGALGSAASAGADGSGSAGATSAAGGGTAADGAGSARPGSRSGRSLSKLAEARAEYDAKRRAEAAAMESRLRALATDHTSLFADGLVYDPSKPVNKDPRAYDKAQEAAALAKAANPPPAAGGRLGSAASPTRERASSAVGLGPSSIGGGMPTPGSLAARRAADEVAAAAAGINAPLPLDPAMRLTAARIKPGYSARRFARHYLTLIAAEIVVDCFWLVHCRLFQGNSSYAQECLLESLAACNLRLLQTLHREARFRFLGALPWAVTDTIVNVYTYFVAGSRALYNERFKLEVGLIVGRVLTGVEVAPVTVLTQLESLFPDDQAAPRVEVSAIPAVTASHEMVLAIERRAATTAAARRKRNGSDRDRAASPGAGGGDTGRSGTAGPGSPPGATGAAGSSSGGGGGGDAGADGATAGGGGAAGGLDDAGGPLAGLTARQAKAALADPQLIALSKTLGYRTVYDLFKTTSDGERDLLGLHDTYAAEALRSLAKSSILPASAFHAAALAREAEERAQEMRNIERRRAAAAARAAANAEADAAGGGIMAFGGGVSEAGSGASAAETYHGSAAGSATDAGSSFEGSGSGGGGNSPQARQRAAAAAAAAASSAGSPGRQSGSVSPSGRRAARKSVSVSGTGAGPASPKARRASASPTGRPQRRLSLVDQPKRMRDGRRLSHIDKRELEAAAKAATGLYTVTTSGGVILSSRGGRLSGITSPHSTRPHSGTGHGGHGGRPHSGAGGLMSPGGGGFHGFSPNGNGIGGDGGFVGGGLQGDHPHMYAQYQEQQMQANGSDDEGGGSGNGNGEALLSPGLGPSGTLRREAKEEKRRDLFIMTARSGGLTDPKQRRIMERIVAAAAAEEAVSGGGGVGLAQLLLQPPSEAGSLASSLSAGALSMLYGGASDATLTPFPSLVPGHGHGHGHGYGGLPGAGPGQHGGDIAQPTPGAIAKVDALAHALASAQQMHLKQQAEGGGGGGDGSSSGGGIGRVWAIPQSGASSTHDEFAFTSDAARGGGGGGNGGGSGSGPGGGRGSPVGADGAGSAAGTRPQSRSPGRDTSREREMREATLDPTSREAGILRKLDAFMRANPLPARGGGGPGGAAGGHGGLRAARGVGGGGLLLPPLAGRPGSSSSAGNGGSGGLSDAEAVIAPVDMMSAALRAASDRMGYSADIMLDRTGAGAMMDGSGYHGAGSHGGGGGALLASGAMGGGVTVMGGSGGFGGLAGFASPMRAGGGGGGVHMQLQLGRQSPRMGAADAFGPQHPQLGVDTFAFGIATSAPNSARLPPHPQSGMAAMGDIAGIAEDDDEDGHHAADEAGGSRSSKGATIKTASPSSSTAVGGGIMRVTGTGSPAAAGAATIAPARGGVGSMRVAGSGAAGSGAAGAAGGDGVAPARGGVGSVRGLPALDIVPSFTAGAGGILMGPGAFNPNASTASLGSMRGGPGGGGGGGLGGTTVGLASSPVHGGGAGGFTVPSLSASGIGGGGGGMGMGGLGSPYAHALPTTGAGNGTVSLAALDRGMSSSSGSADGSASASGSASGDGGAPTEELVTRMLVNRSKTRPLMVAFTYTSTSSLLHRALPDIRTVGTAGAQAIGRTVPVPWARHGGVDTFKAHGGSSGSGSDVRSEVAAAQKRIAETVKALAAESRAFSAAAIEEARRRREELETAGPVKVARAALEVRQERMRRAQIKATESQAARAARQNSRNNMTALGSHARGPGGAGGAGGGGSGGVDLDDLDDGLGRDEFTDRLEARAMEAEAAARAATEGRLDRIPRSILPSGSLVSTGSVSLLDDASSSFGPEDSINSYGLPRDPNKLREVLGLGGGTFTAASVREKYAFKIARQTLGSSPPPSSR